MLLGVLIVILGIYILSQARVPIEKRSIRSGKGPHARVMNKRQCISNGGIVALMGMCFFLPGIGVPFGTPFAAGIVIAAIALIVASWNVRD